MHDNTRPPAPARLIAGPEAAVPVESGKGCRYVNRHIPDWLTVSVVVRVSPMQGVAFWLESPLARDPIPYGDSYSGNRLGRVDLRILLQEQKLARRLIGF